MLNTNSGKLCFISNTDNLPHFSVIIVRIGNACILQGDIRKNSPFLHQEVIFSLPDGFKISGTSYLEANGTRVDGSYAKQQMFIASDSTVQITFNNEVTFLEFTKIYLAD